ncbi:MAG: hypothetical protein EWV41_07720 [Microcystis wesenbergii Mw_MB_S_20031200_S109]|uniref:Uncharacterized protein n=1 Tax=Microcystis wesenbergii Mw_MB_S_20031200_S109D TaxID=2486241 RepID=A0A552LJF0_9CHRO|nr:MAG: hypothetical protein EWV41_07720 [Microcystis wesenbergii Mw_MB_S_20031200_S109]TRV20339.1 MAG: hypothetical protein EWV88_17375 [Microcystis wesenbergii Mw_MB_S_20031200_S109D]
MIKLAVLPQSILLGISLLFNNSLPLLAQSTPLSVDNLRNTVYNIPNRGSVIVSDGIFQSNEGQILGVQVSREALMGDYNNDQRTDGIVVLRVITRDQQQLHYLALVIDNNGTATNTDTVLLADRVIVDNLSAKDGMITVNMRRFLPRDPSCCPSGVITQQLAVNPSINQLTLLSTNESQPTTPNVQVVPTSPLRINNSNLPFQPPAGAIQIRF